MIRKCLFPFTLLESTGIYGGDDRNKASIPYKKGEVKALFFLTGFTLLSLLFFVPIISMAEERSDSLNFWPLFQYSTDPEEGVREIDGLGPFFSWRKDFAQRQWGVRPLLNWTEDEIEPLIRLEFLYPFGKYQIREGEKKGYLFPISLYREEEFEGKRKWEFQFFPFFLGETKEGRGYFGLFPVFGTLLERYGKEEIRFYLWPLYGESTSEGVCTRNLFWPFFSFTEGEKKRGYRFWPIYGRKEEIGVSDSEFFMWPIFLKKRTGLDTDDPVEERMVFPFYVSKESERFESKTYLWPFFSHSVDRAGFEKWDLPWPIFQTLKGENLEGIRIFPFYGYKVKEGVMKRIFILYPVYQLEEDQIDGVRKRTTRIFLLSRIRSGEDKKGLNKVNSLHIWPFFDYERDETGHEILSFFYLFPFKEEGFERNLSPLFRIYSWEKAPKKGVSANLLWGFYKRMKRNGTDSWEIAHLIGMRREKGWKTLSFLKGLFRYWSDGKNADLRLFYLPFHVRWSHQEGSDLKSNEKEFANGQQEDRDIGDGFISSGKDPY